MKKFIRLVVNIPITQLNERAALYNRKGSKSMVKVNSEEVRDKAMTALGRLVYQVFSDQSMTMDGSYETRDYVGDEVAVDGDDDDYCSVIEDESQMTEFLLATAVFIGERGTKKPLTELTGEYILQHHKVVITNLPAEHYGYFYEHTNTAVVYIEDGDIIAEYKEPQE
jgi:hypothetical protein